MTRISSDTIADALNAPLLHAAFVVFWSILIPVAAYTGLLASTTFISVLSLVALVLASGSWFASGIIARRQKEDADVAEAVTLLRSVNAKLDVLLKAR